jgi:CxxC motif-containing protein (DUF1111 family)
MLKSRFSGRRSLTTIAVLMFAATARAWVPSASAQSFGGPSEPGPGPGQTLKATDPGIRGGAAGAGGPVPTLNANETTFWFAAQAVFEEVEAVPQGLGPRFNHNSCASCHAFPAFGGSSPPGTFTFTDAAGTTFTGNPQIKVATLDGATNTIPSFVTTNGPVREARFVRNPDGTPDGGVHDLFVIAGRADAPGCNIQQPNFAAALAQHNVIFRIPTPTFGLGFVEAVSDLGLQNAFSANAQQKASLGISGTFNKSGNTGNITRFGWKAQNPSLLVFSGEAFNVEMGVTNDNFPDKRETNPNCQFNPLPESTTNPNQVTDTINSGSPASDFSQDIVNFAAFMRLNAVPVPAMPIASTSSTSTTQVASASTTSVLSAAAGTSSTSATTASSASMTRGQQVFSNVGCQGCHVINQTTGNSTFTGMSNFTFQPFSDFALHNMGSGLADGISQGNANGFQFRSAPLWGVGQRAFFLHDGRTADIGVAIEQHASSGSEANEVIENFNLLSASDQQALLNFLRSL